MLSRKSPQLISYGFSHHLFEQAAALSQSFEEYRMITPSYISKGYAKLASAIHPWLGKQFAKRTHPVLDPKFSATYPVEHLYQLWAKLRKQPFSYFQAHSRMARRILNDFEPPLALLTIDTGAESLFKAWKGKTFCILDLTIAIPQYRSHIYDQAAKESWNKNVKFHYPCDWELQRYGDEIQLADLILCPSKFVFDSCRFAGVPENRLRILPYGFDPGRFHVDHGSRNDTSTFKIVFVGSFCYRKGSHILLDAFHQLNNAYSNVELHIFGKVIDPPNYQTENVIFYGHLPQTVLAEKLKEMDVMAFPTFFEGSAYAVYQALASGLPVITTPNCGSVVDDSCGILLEEISPDSLYKSLERLYLHQDNLRKMSMAAPKVACQYSWQNYGIQLNKILHEVIPSLSR